MKVFGIIGWKNAGKTSLMERLVANITARGFSVSTVKHVHHDVDLDQPGKDTFRHRQAGAREVVLASAKRHAILTEHCDRPEPELSDILARLSPVDLVLVEGYKRDAHPKVEVFRIEAGHSLIQPDDPLVRAVATDTALAALPVPQLDLNNTVAVADFILRETGLAKDRTAFRAAFFDTVTIVDWSAASSPSPRKPSADAIWIGTASVFGTSSTYHRTRATAEAALTAHLDTEARSGRRVLLGFDFPFGYPEGFARRLTGRDGAQEIWNWLAAHLTDGPENGNDRFGLAAAINQTFGAQGPFWGRPATLHLPQLPATKTADYAALGLAERRRVEVDSLRRAQSVWKLYTAGSVGGQAMTGLPLVARLSRRPGASVWPFDPPTGSLVLAEVYPSLLDAEVRKATGPETIKDELQVRLLSRALWRLSQSGGLGTLFDDVPNWQGRADEGWVLGANHASALASALT
jgi:molybdopterin-guanine dinucleotide biosynthesis protein B